MTSFQQLKNNIPFRAWQHLTVSLLVGLSAGFFAYSLFLQTPVFSRLYLLLGILIAGAVTLITYFLLKQHPFGLKNDYFINRRSFVLIGLLFFMALPSYFFLPPYPQLPFFRRESVLVINVKAGTDPVAWSQFRKLYLNSGVEKLGYRAFQISGPWIAYGDDFILQPGSTGQIVWKGSVGKRASVAIPIPSKEWTITTDWDGEIRRTATDKSPYVRNKNFIPPSWYTGLVYALAWIPLFFIFILMDGFPLVRRIALPALILTLAVIQVNLQFEMLGKEFHRSLQNAIQTVQLFRHFAVLNGTAPSPWQYRVFSEWILESFFQAASFLKLNNSIWVSLWGLRVLQNLILLSLAYMYFVRLGITKTVSIYGMFLLSGGMLHAFYQSDLSYNTYFDLMFYLLAGILILDGRYAWLPILMVVAALNRETSLMIPVLLIAWGWLGKPETRNKALIYGAAALLVGLVIYMGLYLYYPDTPMYLFGDELLPGWGLFRYNLTVSEMPILFFQTLGFLPLIALINLKHWNSFVHICFLFLVPVWIFVHAFTSDWAETRLFLVLLAMAFIPASLPVVERRLQAVRQGSLG